MNRALIVRRRKLPMKTTLTILAAAITLAAASLSAAALTPGVQLAWDACAGDGGASSKMFACTSTSGSEQLVVSYVPGTDIAHFSGIEVFIDINPGYYGTNWWGGACAAPVVRVATPAAAVSCVSPWGPDGAYGGMAALTMQYPSPNWVDYDVACGTNAADVPLLANHEYALLTVTLSHAKSTGVPACTGCLRPAYVQVDRVVVFTEAGQSLANTNQYGDPGTVAWNVAATPARASTWGAIKSLYR
jgi:hypothetical protein